MAGGKGSDGGPRCARPGWCQWQGAFPARLWLLWVKCQHRSGEKSGFSGDPRREEQGGRRTDRRAAWWFLGSPGCQGSQGNVRGNAGRRERAESRLRGEHLRPSPSPRELEWAEHRGSGQMTVLGIK